jgi:hypothetical protein
VTAPKVPTHLVLWRRMQELGLESGEVSVRADVDLIAVTELEWDDTLDAWSVADIKRVLAVLGLDFLEVFGIPCSYCEGTVETLIGLPRNELIRKRRGELGISMGDLLEGTGWTKWFSEYRDEAWAQRLMRQFEGIEDSADAIDELSLYDVMHLNEMVLGLPLQVLLGVKCGRCHN